MSRPTGPRLDLTMFAILLAAITFCVLNQNIISYKEQNKKSFIKEDKVQSLKPWSLRFFERSSYEDTLALNKNQQQIWLKTYLISLPDFLSPLRVSADCTVAIISANNWLSRQEFNKRTFLQNNLTCIIIILITLVKISKEMCILP